MFEIFLQLGLINSCLVLIITVLLIILTFLRENCRNLESLRLKSVQSKNTTPDTGNTKLLKLNIIKIAGTLDLSIIIPAYNEEQRIINTLKDLQDYILNSHLNKEGIKHEVIIVDDGSKDETVKIVKEFVEPFKDDINYPIEFKLVQLETNQGKCYLNIII